MFVSRATCSDRSRCTSDHVDVCPMSFQVIPEYRNICISWPKLSRQYSLFCKGKRLLKIANFISYNSCYVPKQIKMIVFALNLKDYIFLYVIIPVSTSHVEHPIAQENSLKTLKRSFSNDGHRHFCTCNCTWSAHSCKRRTIRQAILFSDESCFPHIAATLRSRAIDPGWEGYRSVFQRSQFSRFLC